MALVPRRSWERRPCPTREGGGRETASRGARSRAGRHGSLEWLVHRRENWWRGRGFGPRLNPGTEVAALTPDENCKRDGKALERRPRSPDKRRGCALRRRVGLREVAAPTLGSHREFRLRGFPAGRRAPNSFRKARFGPGPKVASDRTSGNKRERDLRPQEEELPPIDTSIVQEVEKQQAGEAGNEANQAEKWERGQRGGGQRGG